MIEIVGHGWSIGVDPALGGAILHARHADRDVLRAAPAGCADPLATACFPLVPYANRIADGRFAVDGHAYRLPRNFGDHPHSLHGTGWQAAWHASDRTADSVRLRHDHAADAGWPWPFAAEQAIAIDAAGLAITLTLTNTGDRPMPGGVGLHPYFPARADTVLRFAADAVWLADETQLPTTRVAPDRFGDFARGAPAARDTLVDNAWDGWDGRAEISGGDAATRLTATGAAAVHVYIPPDAGFLCVEPVSHLPDAINRGGMAMLEPGETIALSLGISRAI